MRTPGRGHSAALPKLVARPLGGAGGPEEEWPRPPAHLAQQRLLLAQAHDEDAVGLPDAALGPGCKRAVRLVQPIRWMSSCWPSQLDSRYSWTLPGTGRSASEAGSRGALPVLRLQGHCPSHRAVRRGGGLVGPHPHAAQQGMQMPGYSRAGFCTAPVGASTTIPVQSRRAEALLYVVTGQQQHWT